MENWCGKTILILSKLKEQQKIKRQESIQRFWRFDIIIILLNLNRCSTVLFRKDWISLRSRKGRRGGQKRRRRGKSRKCLSMILILLTHRLSVLSIGACPNLEMLPPHNSVSKIVNQILYSYCQELNQSEVYNQIGSTLASVGPNKHNHNINCKQQWIDSKNISRKCNWKQIKT